MRLDSLGRVINPNVAKKVGETLKRKHKTGELVYKAHSQSEETVYYDPCCGTGAIGLYLRSKGIDADKIYMSDINPSHVEMCKKLGFKHVYQCDVLAEKVNIEYKHMKIIMNPPYSGNLHLKILSHLISLYSEAEIVNLSPIRWLQDPLAEYKQGTDFKRYENIRKRIASIEEVSGEEAIKLFGAAFYSSLGIYHIDDKEQEAFKYEFNTLIYKITNFPCKHFTYDSPEDKPYKIVLPATHGHLGKYDWAEITSKDWEIAKNVKASSETNGYVIMAFDTEAEMKNFYDSLFLKLYKWLVKNIKTTAATAQYIKFVPVLPDYTHPWTDEMLYEYFDLTSEQVNIIKKEIK